jgi:2-polyprenyl-3-methyl-5-hydroxy-6-metoxy-1,4-benzoquinol methylase
MRVGPRAANGHAREVKSVCAPGGVVADHAAARGCGSSQAAHDGGTIVRTVGDHEQGGELAGSAAHRAEWDARYRERGRAMWSGRPNGRLVSEVVDLAPGLALDVGCGEGADAIWLAERGWTVTAIDVSEVAIGRAREAARAAGTSVGAGDPAVSV